MEIIERLTPPLRATASSDSPRAARGAHGPRGDALVEGLQAPNPSCWILDPVYWMGVKGGVFTGSGRHRQRVRRSRRGRRSVGSSRGGAARSRVHFGDNCVPGRTGRPRNRFAKCRAEQPTNAPSSRTLSRWERPLEAVCGAASEPSVIGFKRLLTWDLAVASSASEDSVAVDRHDGPIDRGQKHDNGRCRS